MTSIAPGSCSRIGNEYYKSEEEFIYACADAMREEYKAIIDAGLVLQLDDPSIAENWDQINPAPTVDEYRKFTMIRVEALNYAIKGLPQDRIRFHLCWGSWHGPHVTDIPMRDIVDVMLAINAQAYSFEAGNVRHEHEWRVWEDVKLPAGKLIIPGVVSHATNVVEHPDLVADRIVRFAKLVGRENVLAGTGLRARRTRASGDRVGQAEDSGRGRGAGDQSALDVIPAAASNDSRRGMPSVIASVIALPPAGGLTRRPVATRNDGRLVRAGKTSSRKPLPHGGRGACYSSLTYSKSPGLLSMPMRGGAIQPAYSPRWRTGRIRLSTKR